MSSSRHKSSTGGATPSGEASPACSSMVAKRALSRASTSASVADELVERSHIGKTLFSSRDHPNADPSRLAGGRRVPRSRLRRPGSRSPCHERHRSRPPCRRSPARGHAGRGPNRSGTCGTADRYAGHARGRLSTTDRDVLPVLATGSRRHFEVVTNGVDLGEHVRPVADQIRVPERFCDPGRSLSDRPPSYRTRNRPWRC